jgi:hypothetical protein
MGYGTRRVVSCDYGNTWTNDENDISNGGDDGYLVRGVGYGDGKFVAAVGGAGVQKLFLSLDGVTWDRQQLDGNGFSDVVYGAGRFVAGGGHASRISFDGKNWEQPGTMGSGGILRRMTFGDYQGGRFVAVGDEGRRMNSTDGVTWGNQVSSGAGLIGVAFGAGRFVAIRASGSIVYSDDGGASWTEDTIAGATNLRGILFDGRVFIVTTADQTFRSPDGAQWSHAGNEGPGPFDVSSDGAHYAGWYSGKFYSSSDGVNWSSSANSGQSLQSVKFGWVMPSSVCPLR